MKVYINYPNPHITIHRNRNCSQVQMHEKQNQRMIVVTLENLGRILSDIAAKKYTFAANDKENDLWLDLNLDHDLQNESVIRVIQAIFGEFYGPIKESEIIEHSCKNT